MNGPQLKFAHLIPENNKKFAIDGIVICCDCGNQNTTILTFGIYCRDCRNFRLFRDKASNEYRPTGTVLDLD
jgi:DNA-directed RNA polymerase subunit RPC12/RpoP